MEVFPTFPYNLTLQEKPTCNSWGDWLKSDRYGKQHWEYYIDLPHPFGCSLNSLSKPQPTLDMQVNTQNPGKCEAWLFFPVFMSLAEIKATGLQHEQRSGGKGLGR